MAARPGRRNPAPTLWSRWIPDVARVMAGGYSTARSMGLGLSGSKRLVDQFSLETAPGKGTVVVVTKWTQY